MAVTDRALEEQWWNGVGGEKEFQEGGDICILKADLHFCVAETNTTL